MLFDQLPAQCMTIKVIRYPWSAGIIRDNLQVISPDFGKFVYCTVVRVSQRTSWAVDQTVV